MREATVYNHDYDYGDYASLIIIHEVYTASFAYNFVKMHRLHSVQLVGNETLQASISE